MTPRPAPGGAAPRPAHPSIPALVEGAELSAGALAQRPDAQALADFAKMMANAEYWLSFDLASFEPLLARCPSPLRELGVAVLLRFSEDVGGALELQDILRAREGLQATLPMDLWPGVEAGLDTLARAVKARDAQIGWTTDGFVPHMKDGGMNLHTLRAMGSARIAVAGADDKDKLPHVPVGAPVEVHAADERGRPLDPPEVESLLGAEVLVRDADKRREVVFLIPGEYHLRVPTKATGDRKLVAR